MLIIIVVQSLKRNEKKYNWEIGNGRKFPKYAKNDYDNVNTHYTTKHSLHQIDPTAPRNEKCSVICYNLEQINPILILLYAFGYNITNNGFEKRNEIEFEIQNERAVIIVFNNRFDCSALLPSAPSLMMTVDQCRTVFDVDLDKIGTRLSNHVYIVYLMVIMPKILVIVAKKSKVFPLK